VTGVGEFDETEMSLHLVDHPVIRERLTRIRSIDSVTAEFRAALHDVSRLLCYEVTRDLAARNLLFHPFRILVTLGPGKEGVQCP